MESIALSEQYNASPLFVVGSARSGTSLMASICGTAGVYAAYGAESMILLGQEKYGSLSISANFDHFVQDYLNSRQYVRSGLSERRVRQLIWDNRSSYLDVHKAIMYDIAVTQNKLSWIDSTPSYSRFLNQILDYYPQAKVIYAIRSPFASINSLMELGWTGVPFSNRKISLVSACKQWLDANQPFIKLSSAQRERVMLVRYEDVVLNYKQVEQDIERFLGVKLDIHHPVGEYSSLVKPNSSFVPAGGGISSAGLERWKGKLLDEEVAYINDNCKYYVEKYGYQLSDDYGIYRKSYIFTSLFVDLYRGSKYIVNAKGLARKYVTSPFEIGLK